MPRGGVLRSPYPETCINRHFRRVWIALEASALRRTKLHVAVVDGYALRWLKGKVSASGAEGIEPQTQEGKRDDRGPYGGQSRSLVRASVRTMLLHKVSRSVQLLQSSVTFYLQSSTFEVGDAGIEPATSAV